MERYNKTQYGTFINILFLFIMGFIAYAYVYQLGNQPIPFEIFIILFPLFGIILLFFYKLTIKIDDEKITAIFGIGIIKRTINIENIMVESIKEVKIPWYYGIGIRLTPKGWLYNVKFGKSIIMKTKHKTFLVGTDDANTIKKILINLKNN
jgi:hypothetical protein